MHHELEEMSGRVNDLTSTLQFVCKELQLPTVCGDPLKRLWMHVFGF